VLMSAVSAYYYLRVVYVFWMQSSDDVSVDGFTEAALPPATPTAVGTLLVCAVALLVLGVFFGGILETTSTFFEAASMAAAP